ncbi:1-phosphatidylinositol 3-phosphate 5-kinase-like isoform X2 [Dendronephthya gigantea]|uniref:1-phosphatidylinositol 3-phosphate 5-kinase-like isoform X2 n=1 Tax=Dendronephthya gigantea TaxID=151771 RepID=UPI0010698E01|nr:1-phosphatidylinositol 3-phosphate 5-kinase-like isoform X2 [Dendronephthya gigantea]
MGEQNEEEGYTFISFKPLSPEGEKSGLRKLIEGFKSKRFVTAKNDTEGDSSQNSLENSTQSDTQHFNSNVRGEETSNKHGSVLQELFSRGNKSHDLDKREIVETRNSRTRTPSSVLRRLSQLVLLEKANPQQLQGTNNLKKYWMPDEQCKVCYECGVKFHTFRRRHHCRLCGQIFCSRCCNEVVSGHQIGYTGVFRVCIYCKKIVLTYTSGSDIEKNFNQLKEDLRLIAHGDSNNPSTGNIHGWNPLLDDSDLNRTFDVLGVSAEEADLLKQDSYKNLWKQITTPKTGLEFLSHKIRLRSYSTCFVGRDLINWLMMNRKAPNRAVALHICRGLLDLGWIEPLDGEQEDFKDDFVVYIPGPRASGEVYNVDLVRTPSSSSHGKREPNSWLSTSFDHGAVQSSREGFTRCNSATTIVNQDLLTSPRRMRSLSCEDVMVKASGKESSSDKDKTSECLKTQSPRLDVFVNIEDCYLPSGLVPEQASEETGTEDDVTEQSNKKEDKVTAEDLRLSSSEKSEEAMVLNELNAIHTKHISSLLVQLLDRVGLSQSWKDIIEPLAIKICETVVPGVVKDDNMDIRHYVKIKKVPWGSRSDCRIVNGVVCTKNIVHKKMASSITEPNILMLACPVDFQRVENKMAFLDSLVLQEEEFLKNMVGRIVALKPDLVLVEKTVSRLAQDMLLQRGISVILNINPKLMSRISRCVNGDVLLSLDQGSRPRLGTCKKFKIEKFVFENGERKTLAFFEGCSPSLGATIVLRGARRMELKKVADVLGFMIFVSYNSTLEKAFIMDEFGTPFSEDTQDDKTADDENSHQGKVMFSVEGETLSHEETAEVSESEDYTTLQETMEPTFNEIIRNENSETGCEEAQPSLATDHSTENKLGDGEKNDTGASENRYFTSVTNPVNSESFQNILDSVILSSSPLVRYPLPFSLTEDGKKCELNVFLTDEAFWSPLFAGETSSTRSLSVDEVDNVRESESACGYLKERHPFVFAVLGEGAKDVKTQELLANYRAEGGRITAKRPDNWELKGIDVLDSSCKEGESVRKGICDDQLLRTYRVIRTESEQYSGKVQFLRDCFDPFLHQMIAVVFSSYSRESGNFPRSCISPWTVFMEFYGRNDLTLGCFLERYCFRSSYVCPSPNCDIPMVKHVRYFAHGDGAIHINMKNLKSPIPGYSRTLLTWSWCKQCKQVTPVVPVSSEAWRLSFAKYIELRIYASSYRRRSTLHPCDHSLHQDHYQYFAYNNIVASLKYVSLNIYKVHLPPTTIKIVEEERQPQFWIKHIQAMVHQLVNVINERIALLKTEAYITSCVTDIAYDRGRLDEKVKVLDSKAMLLLSPPSSPGESKNNRLLEPHEVAAVEYEILDGITLLKRMMCEYGEKWNSKLFELFQLENEKKKSQSMKTKNSGFYPSSNSVNGIETSQVSDVDNLLSGSTASQINPFAVENIPSSTENNHSNPNYQLSGGSHQNNQRKRESSPGPSDIDQSIDQSIADEEELSRSCQRGFNHSTNQKLRKHSKLWATLTEEVSSTLKDVQYVEDRPGPKVKRIFSQFLPGVSFRSIPSPFPMHEHHLLPASDEIPIVVNEKEPTSIIAYTLSSPEYQEKLYKIQELMEEYSESFTCVDGDCLSVPSDGMRSRTRTRSEAETFSSSSLLNTHNEDFVEDYFQWSELDEDDAVTEDKTVKNPSNLGDAGVKTGEDGIEKDKVEIKEPNLVMQNGVTPQENAKIEDSITDGKEFLVSSGLSAQDDVEYHIKHSFADSSAKFFCIVYFGEQFRRIRKAVFPDGEEKFIRSLQNCLTWEATGGKSGSSFCKTTDDRFVIKEMSRPESQSFLNIAPHYFQYIEKALEDKTPTLLAKILGVYRIGYNSKLTNTPVRKDFLVMDNLLYNCKVDQIFDLKGSVRSRYVNTLPDNEVEKVLLDENLLEMIAESPLFIRPHSKAVLSRAIMDDTKFLAKHMVMDYSLLLGIERGSSKLIVGIIDFIRTFTWDKKLEMYVKSTGILGGQGKMPTVVSPDVYRERFCEAMQSYFLMIPNKWMGLGNEQLSP